MNYSFAHNPLYSPGRTQKEDVFLCCQFETPYACPHSNGLYKEWYLQCHKEINCCCTAETLRIV